MTRALRVAAAGCCLVLGACASSAPQDRADGRAPARLADDATRYVALGDSFVAGPGIDPEDEASGICRRSERNWPALVAERMDLELTDVSCVGAGVLHLREDVEVDDRTYPAQTAAVRPDTDLVTVGVGANDQGVLGGLVAACGASAASCRGYADETLPQALATTRRDLVAVLGDVRAGAPEAVVLVVGYPPLSAGDRPCEQLPVPEAALEPLADGLARLDAMLARAAEQAGASFLPVRREAAEHDVCGDEPWVNGVDPAPGDGEILHPGADGMAGVATLVVDRLRR